MLWHYVRYLTPGNWKLFVAKLAISHGSIVRPTGRLREVMLFFEIRKFYFGPNISNNEFPITMTSFCYSLRCEPSSSSALSCSLLLSCSSSNFSSNSSCSCREVTSLSKGQHGCMRECLPFWSVSKDSIQTVLEIIDLSLGPSFSAESLAIRVRYEDRFLRPI